jgi:hypothetical protein
MFVMRTWDMHFQMEKISMSVWVQTMVPEKSGVAQYSVGNLKLVRVRMLMEFLLLLLHSDESLGLLPAVHWVVGGQGI